MVAAVGIVFLVVLAAIAAGYARHGLKKAPLAVRCCWWLTGRQWDGRQHTTASWFRSGEITARHHVPRFYTRPRVLRAAQRSGTAAGAVFAVAAVLSDPGAAMSAAVALLASSPAVFGLLVWREVRGREVRREVLKPLHERLWQQVGAPRTEKPRRWLAVAADRQSARVYLPDLYDASPKALEAVQRVVAQTVFCATPDMAANMAGRRRYLEFTAAKPPPPRMVTLHGDPAKGVPGIMAEIEAAAWHELVIGYGVDGRLVKRSLGGDLPHWGLSMPSGGGKSVTAELIAAQMLFHGAICLILDYKVFSHPWALFEMPNVSYAGTPEQIHLSLLWLKDECARRKGRVLNAIQLDGTIAGDVGPVVFVVAEELNATVGELKAYWRSIGGTGPSPAVEALREMLFVGRALGIHFLLIAQKLTVSALGGKDSAARENCAGLLMGGQSSPSSWKMLADDVERPAKQAVAGRHFVVDRGEVELVQVAWLNPKGTAGPEARQLALSGAVTAVPEGIPQGIAKPVTPALESLQVPGMNPRSEPGDTLVLSPATPSPADDLRSRPVGLAEAVERGVIQTWDLGALRQQRWRENRKGGRSLFPKPADTGARGEELYWAAELREFERIKRGIAA